MAVQEDYEALVHLLNKRSLNHASIVGCSLDQKQKDIVSRYFKQTRFVDRAAWDFDHRKDISTDVVLCCNVFHYAKDPALWISNILPVCRELWITDIIHRRRGGLEEFGGDGDCMRYNYNGLLSLDNRFDLSGCGDTVVDFWTYDAGSFRSGTLCVNFAAVLKGYR